MEGRTRDAYMIASLMRAKKLPKLEELIRKRGSKEDRMKDLKAALGARVKRHG